MSGRHSADGSNSENDPTTEPADDTSSRVGEANPDDDIDAGETGAEARAAQD